MTEIVVISGIEQLRKQWFSFLLLGILMVILGSVAIGSSVVMTLTSVFLFGCLLIVSGIGIAGSAFLARQWSGFFVLILIGILDLVLGGMIVAHPAAAALELTLLLAAYFMVGGIFRIAIAVAEQFPHWAWEVIGGLVSLLLGVLIWKQWPYSGFFIIGFCVGINLLFHGLSLVMLAIAVRQTPATPV